MTNMIYLFVFSTLIFQVLALEAENFRLDNDTDATNRGLFGLKPTNCLNKLNIPSAGAPAIVSASPLHRLANGRVYFFSPPAATATWFQARDYCTTRGMHLVTLDTVRENQLVFAQATALLMANGAGPGAWIGLRDISLLDFRSVLRDVQPAFTAFSAVPAGGGLCVNYLAAAATSAAASWATTACGGGPLAFICEMELPCSAIVPAIKV